MGQGDLVGGRFEPIRIVGSGGMGTVYEARDTRTGTAVALKLLNETSEEDGRRLQREALALRDLDHPAIVRYVAHGTHDDRPYLVMEWLRGEDLCQRLGRGPLSVEETVVLARRVADALAFLHARGILHRDVKPSNVFLEDGEIAKAKLVDFGLAKRPKDLGVTRAGEIVGTAAYMAPEQLRGDVLDVRADVYGLGNVVFEALAGQRPFAGPTTETVTRILREEPPRLDTLRPDVTPALATLVARMLARERWNRPADGRMVVAELADLEAAAAAVDLELGFVWMDASGKRAVPGISALERRLACVLTVDWDGATFDDRARISDLARRHGAKVTERPGLRFALSFDEDVPVEDQVILATRAALAASRLSGAATLEVRLGHGEPSDEAPRPTRRERGAVHVDDATEQLLPSRFTRVYANGWVVVAEQSELDLPRMIGGVIPPFVGRRAELTRLCNVTLDAFSKRTMRAAMITGEPGAGASRLRQEALRRVGAAHPTLALLTVRGDVAFARLPLEALRAAVRRFAWLDGGPEDAHRLRERVRRHVPSALESAVLEPLLELVGATELPEPFPRASDPERSLAEDVRRALGALIARETSETPALLLVEDVDTVDDASLDVLFDVLRDLDATPVVAWLVGTSAARPRLDALARTLAPFAAVRFQLGPFDEAERRALFRGVLPPGTDEEVVLRGLATGLAEPRLIEEWAIMFRETGEAPESPAPFEARLAHLPIAERRALRGASIIGRVFWLGALAAVLGEHSDRVAITLGSLIEKGWLVERPFSHFGSERELAFACNAGLDAAEAGLDASDRVAGHGIVGRWLERMANADDASIAMHLVRAGALHVAAIHYARAAERALETGRTVAALEHAARGLSCGPDPTTEAWLLSVGARGRRVRGGR